MKAAKALYHKAILVLANLEYSCHSRLIHRSRRACVGALFLSLAHSAARNGRRIQLLRYKARLHFYGNINDFVRLPGRFPTTRLPTSDNLKTASPQQHPFLPPEHLRVAE